MQNYVTTFVNKYTKTDLFEEEKSNQLTQKLCDWTKTHNRLPQNQGNPMLGGSTSPTDTRIGYNIDIDELKLFNHLNDLKKGEGFPSDIEILKKYNLENVIEKEKILSPEERSKENIIKLAEFYKKNGRYPLRNHKKNNSENKLSVWLYRKRTNTLKTYPNEKELGISLGLPEDWLDLFPREENSKENIYKFAEFYKKNERYPCKIKNNPEELKLYYWLYGKRTDTLKTYPNEKELGISLGLPEDWLGVVEILSPEERSKENIYKLAEFYQKNGRYPCYIKNNPEEYKLSHWLYQKRSGRFKTYPNEKELGISLGLPEDWLGVVEILSPEERSKENIIKLAEFYQKNGRYPKYNKNNLEEDKLSHWLYQKRSRIYMVYPNEKELGISLGLPHDWLDVIFLLEKNKENIRKLAEFYKNNGRYPLRKKNNLEEDKLSQWLYQKRSGKNMVYPNEKELGISLGLPEDWLDVEILSKEERSKENIRKLAEFYKKNGRYPKYNKNNLEEDKLSHWLYQKRSRIYMVYPNEKELGISLGLPHDWLDVIFLLEKNKENIRKLAEFYKNNGRYPLRKKNNLEEDKLSQWLYQKRSGKNMVYPNEKELGISLGLPHDWLV